MQLSRREFIGLGLAGLGAVAACACGGAGLAAYLIARRPSNELAPVALATSALNRHDQEKTLERPPIVSKADWGGLEPNHEAENETGFYTPDHPEGWRIYEGDIRETYTTLVVHHSVIDEATDSDTLLEIQRLHREDRGWADVAYHFFIGKDGTVYEGRNMAVRGSHVAGYNTGSLGVCLLGDMMVNEPTAEQITALGQLGRWLTARLMLTHMAGHRDFNPETLCPGANMVGRLSELAAVMGLTYGTEGYTGPQPSTPTPDTSACFCHI